MPCAQHTQRHGGNLAARMFSSLKKMATESVAALSAELDATAAAAAAAAQPEPEPEPEPEGVPAAAAAPEL
eukprot:COSAG04_NODE_21071_length_380_cov_1.270463_1_plen_70_part_01